MQEKQLFVKFCKREFWLKEVTFLGHVILTEGFHLDLKKIEEIMEWRLPKSVIEVWSFLDS